MKILVKGNIIVLMGGGNYSSITAYCQEDINVDNVVNGDLYLDKFDNQEYYATGEVALLEGGTNAS